MKILSNQAATLFFPSTSLKFVYFEAIANSIDAGADKISIDIELDSFTDQDSFKITIEDNGKGFIDENFNRFNKVLDATDDQHKGIGRLVFLKYFKKINVESAFAGKERQFVFDKDFDGESTMVDSTTDMSYSRLEFTNYTKDKIKEYSYVIPDQLKDSILEHFLPRFYKMKIDREKLDIYISLDVKAGNPEQGFVNSSAHLDISTLPELKEKKIDDTASLFGQFRLLYSIDSTYEENKVISAICADGRTIPMEIISSKDFPIGYEMVFILYSDYFDGKTNTTRESFSLDEATLRHVKKNFTKMVAEVVRSEIPEVNEYNTRVQATLSQNYPHLQGYFDKDTVGLLDKSNVVNDAQNQFFKDQKEILEAEELTDDQYEKSLEHSSRLLTEYVLYRTKIIHKLKEIDEDSPESDIHNLIVPQRKIFKNKTLVEIYSNNAWVLDDKYMTYSKVLSDVEVEAIFKEIEVEGSHVYSKEEIGRPDITIILSGDPEHDEKVDAVIVELKKLGLKLSDKETTISQLKQRARRLLEFYPNKIQRLWFYGIIDFDKEFIASIIEDGFVQLYSKGELFCKTQNIILDTTTMEKKSADLFLLSYEAMLEDAESRNSTFLKILRQGFKEMDSPEKGI